MEADKLTVFLFLMLVVVMAFSGFVLYDALTGMPFPNKVGTGATIGFNLNNPGISHDDVGSSSTISLRIDPK